LAGAFLHRHASTGGRHSRLLPLYLNLSILAVPNVRASVPFEIAYVLIVALLMASRIPHFSGKRIGRVPREYVIVVLFGFVTCILLLAIFPMEMLIALSFIYLATIPSPSAASTPMRRRTPRGRRAWPQPKRRPFRKREHDRPHSTGAVVASANALP